MALFIGEIIGTLTICALDALLGAFVVQFATKAIAKFKPAYRTAYYVSFIGTFFIEGFGLIIRSVFTTSVEAISLPDDIILIIIWLVLFSCILGFFLKHPKTGAVGFKTGARISLSIVVVCVVLFWLIRGSVHIVAKSAT